jgi:hypothetical protein
MKETCAFCRHEVEVADLWELSVGKASPVAVHKRCGKTAIAAAPAGVKPRLQPSPELKKLWAKRQAEKAATEFWKERFPQLTQLRDRLAQSVSDVSDIDNLPDRLSPLHG